MQSMTCSSLGPAFTYTRVVTARVRKRFRTQLRALALVLLGVLVAAILPGSPVHILAAAGFKAASGTSIPGLGTAIKKLTGSGKWLVVEIAIPSAVAGLILHAVGHSRAHEHLFKVGATVLGFISLAGIFS